MQNAVRIDPTQIPEAEMRNLAASLIDLMLMAKSDPKIEQEFQEWKRNRKQ